MKGLCEECSVEVGGSLACKNCCEEKVMAINESQENQPSIQKYAMAMRVIGPSFILAYGLYVTLYWSGLLSNHRDNGLVGIGVVSIMFGVGLLYRAFVKRKNA